METLCVIWLMFFSMMYISAYHKIYQPYGPLMCKTVESRYGSVIKYHQNNFTCDVSCERTDFANKSCVEVIYNRKRQPVCIRATSPEPRSPRLFLKLRANYLTSVDTLSGKQVNTVTVPESEPFISCSKDNQQTYFYSKQKCIFSLDPHSGKIETLTKPHKGGRLRGMAIDGPAQILYAFTKINILKLKIGQDSDFSIFQTNAFPFGIATSPKRGQLFVYNSKGIHIYNASTGRRRIMYSYPKITDLVYDGNSDSLYFVRHGYVRHLSCDPLKLWALMTVRNRALHIGVYQEIAFIYTNNNMLFAINMTSKFEIWSRKVPDLVDLCIPL